MKYKGNDIRSLNELDPRAGYLKITKSYEDSITKETSTEEFELVDCQNLFGVPQDYIKEGFSLADYQCINNVTL